MEVFLSIVQFWQLCIPKNIVMNRIALTYKNTLNECQVSGSTYLSLTLKVNNPNSKIEPKNMIDNTYN